MVVAGTADALVLSEPSNMWLCSEVSRKSPLACARIIS